jgi:hypothetical protein
LGNRWDRVGLLVVCLSPGLALSPRFSLAQDTMAGAPNFFAAWERRASAIQSEQPHWVTPLVTVTPRLEQEFRADLVWRTAPNGTETTIYDNGKGLELIPFSPIELLVNLPPYVVHRNRAAPDGWGDWPLLLKYRVFSHNETHGDDILTLFLGGTIPTGGRLNGNGVAVVTPSVAGGKGWGDIDVQATAGMSFPTGRTAVLGHPILYNGTAQYRIHRFFWPEVELNGTSWRDGDRVGMTQIFVTPGIVFGRFPIHDRLGVTVGAGIQIAATHFRQYDHAWTLTARVPF